MWLGYAFAAAVSGAVFMTITKAGLGKVDPTVGLAVQSVCSLVVAWAVVLGRGKASELATLDGRSWGLMVASGLITGVSSLLLFQALKHGPASRVTPVDRTSFVFAAILAAVFLGEKIGWQTGLGLALMCGGVALIAFGKEG